AFAAEYATLADIFADRVEGVRERPERRPPAGAGRAIVEPRAIMVEHREERSPGLLRTGLGVCGWRRDGLASDPDIPGVGERDRRLGGDRLGSLQQPDCIAQPGEMHPVVRREAEDVDPSRAPSAGAGLLPVGVSDRRRAGPLLERYEAIGV